jgi:hypothetical protein
MLSRLDQAIKENIEKEHTLQTFYNQVLVDVDDVEDYHCETCYESHLDNICHVWQGQTRKDGYGAFTIYSKSLSKKYTVKAHRFAYAAAYGFDALPLGTIYAKDRLVINHICHNRACVNPMHLEVITNNQNLSHEKRKPRKPNDAIVADNLEDFMEQIRTTERE